MAYAIYGNSINLSVLHRTYEMDACAGLARGPRELLHLRIRRYACTYIRILLLRVYVYVCMCPVGSRC